MKFLAAGRTSPTLLDQFNATNRRPAGFDYMRVALAVSIICYHSVLLSYRPEVQHWFVQDTPAKAWIYLLVPMFFALSGFLVAGSLERTRSIFSFLGLRVLRILPALGAEILLSALLLGSLFTVLPLREYLASSGLHAYFLNIIGDIHFYLPGVFASNPVKMVNGQLWTVPAELACYVTLAALFLFGICRRRALFAGIFLGAQLLVPVALVSIPGAGAAIGGAANGLLVLMFISGVTIFFYRDRIPWRADFAATCFAAYLVLLYVPGGYGFIAIPVGYLTVYLGLLNPPKNKMIESGDYSYGLYLYGYPIQQAVVAISPVTHAWWINLALSLPLAFCFAAGSWHLLEKRVLRWKPYVMAAEVRILGVVAGIRAMIVGVALQRS
ncbi:MAG: acyltransferase [Alphaproteobacteria bacterium]|nr:acyltransferase [Alphaproteobacteria bacterium]MBV9063238.1 acyltransferase [Alphaproteobacteria bacterium]